MSSQSTSAPDSISGTRARIRVLHVDDETDFNELVAIMLEQEDDRFDVYSCTSASEGLDWIAETEFDCVVSDYDMPRTDGIEFLEAVRNRSPDLPFILYTGKGSEEIASEAISAGVTDYLQKKPGNDQYTVLANRILNAVSGYRAVREAKQMADRLEKIRQNVRDVIWISSPDKQTIEFVSDSYEEVWGRTPESLIEDPQSFMDAIFDDDRDRILTAQGTQKNNPNDYDEIYRIVHPDGDIRWVNVSSASIHENGELTGIVGVATDITDLKEYEQELIEEQAFTQSALKTAVDFFWGIDLEGYVTKWSDADGSVTGYTPDEALGLHTSTFHPDDHFPRIADAIEELKESGAVVVEADLLKKDGERVPFEFAGTVIPDDNGGIHSMCGIGRNLSELQSG